MCHKRERLYVHTYICLHLHKYVIIAYENFEPLVIVFRVFTLKGSTPMKNLSQGNPFDLTTDNGVRWNEELE